MKTVTVSNKIQCINCKEIIESKHHHDFVMCKCGKVGVDGGKEYFRRIGNETDYIDLSVVHQIPETPMEVIQTK